MIKREPRVPNYIFRLYLNTEWKLSYELYLKLWDSIGHKVDKETEYAIIAAIRRLKLCKKEEL